MSGRWPTAHDHVRQWRDTGALEALPEDLIAQAAEPEKAGRP